MTVYWLLAWLAIRKNTAYVWAHMGNNIGSILFGLVYMALWRAAARGRSVGNLSAHHLVNYIAVSQVVLWISTFLPRDLYVSTQIRSGQIALELMRPIGYFPRTLAAGAGEVVYNFIFRSAPLALTFTVLGVMPWTAIGNGVDAALVAVAFALAGFGGLLFQYLIGISAFWTTETRWARRLFLALVTLCGGQLVPIALMPPGAQQILSWLPFQSLVSFPVLVWMHLASWQTWVSSTGWIALLCCICAFLTWAGRRRVEVQGG